MKATGIVRNVDELGRIVLPKELRRLLDIDTGSPLEIYMNKDQIILQKYKHSCAFCGTPERRTTLNEFCGKYICPKCVALLRQELK